MKKPFTNSSPLQATLGATLAMLATLVTITGCGPTIAEVTGTVRVDGKPAGPIAVYFKRDGSSETFESLPRADLSYYLQMPSGKNGIPTGTYNVWLGIRSGLEGLPESVRLERTIPETYWSESNELTCTVTSSGTVFDIDIKAK